MAITDLTKTRWYFNETINSDLRTTFNINFIGYGYIDSARNEGFELRNQLILGTDIAQLSIKYVQTKYLSDGYGNSNAYYVGRWTGEKYRSIEIIGGSDAKNPGLIAFLEANAVQLSPINLRNTTWVFTSGVNTTTGLGTYNINFTSNGENFVKLSTTYRGYTPISYYRADGTEIKAYDNSQWTNQAYRTITIIDGADIESMQLYNFLNAAGFLKIEFAETKTALKIYEDLSQKEYDGLEKDDNTFYQVNDVGVYKGTKLIASNKPDPYIYEQSTHNDVSFPTSGGELLAYFSFTTGVQGRAYVLTLTFFNNTGGILQQTTPLLFFLAEGKSQFVLDGGINVDISYTAPGMYIYISGTSEYINSDTKHVHGNIYQLTNNFKEIYN